MSIDTNNCIRLGRIDDNKHNIMLIPHISMPDRYDTNDEIYPTGILSIMNNINSTALVSFNCYIYDINHLIDVNTITEVAAAIAEEKPSIVGFSTNCTNMPYIAILAKYIKTYNSTICIILGGPEASVLPEEYFTQHEQFDSIFIGESENTFNEFLEDFTANRIEKYYRNKTNVDTLSITLHTDINWKYYVNNEFSRGYPIETGRGCPYKCYFCSTRNFFNNSCRRFPIEIITDAISCICENTHIRSFSFVHDMFAVDEDFLKNLFHSLERRNIQIEWGASVRADKIGSSILGLMEKYGCKRLFIGIESASDHIQQKIRKGIAIDKIERLLKEILAIKDLKVVLSFIYGFPFETFSDFDATVHMIESLMLDNHHESIRLQFHLLFPLIGSDMYANEAVNYHVFTPRFFYLPSEAQREITLFEYFYPRYYVYESNSHVSEYLWIEEYISILSMYLDRMPTVRSVLRCAGCRFILGTYNMLKSIIICDSRDSISDLDVLYNHLDIAIVEHCQLFISEDYLKSAVCYDRAIAYATELRSKLPSSDHKYILDAKASIASILVDLSEVDLARGEYLVYTKDNIIHIDELSHDGRIVLNAILFDNPKFAGNPYSMRELSEYINAFEEMNVLQHNVCE